VVNGGDMVLSPVLSFPNGFHVKLIKKLEFFYEPLQISPEQSETFQLCKQERIRVSLMIVSSLSSMLDYI